MNDHRLAVWRAGDRRFEGRTTVPAAKFRPGANLLTFQCYNRVAGRGEGRSERTVRVRCLRKPARPALHGLAVGVADYSRSLAPDGKPWPDLPGALNDAVELADRWKQRTAPLYDPVRSRTDVLPGKDGDASPAAVLARIKEIARRAKAEDVALVFLAGHGDLVETSEGGVFVFCGPSYDRRTYRRTGITSHDLFEALAAIPCRKVVLLDACQAGGLSTSPVRDLTPGGLGPTILAACGRGERSYEDKRLGKRKGGHGLFSFAVLQALDQTVATLPDNLDRRLGPRGLFDAVVERHLPALLRAIKKEGAQNPVHFPFDLEEEPSLAAPPDSRKKK